MDRTFVMCKPDAVERGLVGEIIRRIEQRDLRIVALELRTIDEATATRHYAEHEGKPFFADLLSFITRGPAVPMVVEGPEDTWQVVRTMMGATNPRGGPGHPPRRPGHRVHREPGPRVRRPRQRRPRDRPVLSGALTIAFPGHTGRAALATGPFPTRPLAVVGRPQRVVVWLRFDDEA